jgi:hypothetical protein
MIMASKDYHDGDERITVDLPSEGSEEPGDFVTITRYAKDGSGRRHFVESVCFSMNVWRKMLADANARSARGAR